MDRSDRRFVLWLSPWVLLLAFGLYASYLCLRYGLNQTNMDNRFAFGLWIFLDLSVIALGAGAFFTGFLLYIMKWRELRAVINSAVIVGFLCYSGAVAVLAIDVGQPLRFWFTFRYPNVHSMLTEVTFCITCYLIVLSLEYLPIIFSNKSVGKQLHAIVPALALIGTFLSFFHQGSLGGLYGVLRGRPFAYREGFVIWPSTFFLFIASAIAVGPSFILLTTTLAEKVANRRLVALDVKRLLARTSGALLIVYVLLKSVDTLIWLNSTSRQAGFLPWEYYAWKPFGFWILLAEIVVFGFIPALMLLSKHRHYISAAILACFGVVLNRFVLTIQTLALPTLPFDEFMRYVPSWQECGVLLGVIAYAVIVYSLSYRYLKLFPEQPAPSPAESPRDLVSLDLVVQR